MPLDDNDNAGWTPELVRGLRRDMQEGHRIQRRLIEILHGVEEALAGLRVELAHMRTANERAESLKQLDEALAAASG